MMRLSALSAVLFLSGAPAVRAADELAVNAGNPIRKVVTMLQNMQRKIDEEGKKQEEAYDKFMCYCKTNKGELSEGIEAAKAKIESVDSALKQAAEAKTQTEADLKEHQTNRAEAKDTMSKATAMREKEAAAFAKEKAELDTNLGALAKAISALEKGMAGAFVQTPAATIVRKFAMEKADMPDGTREELLSFLSGTQGTGYAPASGEITGILKTMEEEMQKDLDDATTEETAAIENFKALMAAKNKEVETLSKQIEEEMMRVGEMGVQIAGMANDLEDTKAALDADTKFQMELETSCSTKTAEWEEIKKTRAEELVAIAETIKVLNDDDALDLFKKTLPSAGSASFVQLGTDSRATAAGQALAIISKAAAASSITRPQLDLIAMALKGKKIGFEKVIKMIDDMLNTLKKEQVDDDAKKEYCDKQLDLTDDKKKGLEQSISDSELAIEEMEGTIATLVEDIKSLEAGIKALDKSVLEATELRKEENAEYKELVASDSSAIEILGWAKNRLNKFYNPKLYKAPPKRELVEGAALVQIAQHDRLRREAPPPPPETFGAYSTKSQEGNGVVAMIDLLIKDLDKELQEAGVMEKDAQKEYEKVMAESAAKRAADSKSVTEKASTKAATEEALQNEKESKAGAVKEHMTTVKYLQALHSECDWLMQYHDVRKEARASEMESLTSAKAVLAGADFALLQKGDRKAGGFMAPRRA